MAQFKDYSMETSPQNKQEEIFKILREKLYLLVFDLTLATDECCKISVDQAFNENDPRKIAKVLLWAVKLNNWDNDAYRKNIELLNLALQCKDFFKEKKYYHYRIYKKENCYEMLDQQKKYWKSRLKFSEERDARLERAMRF